MNRIIVAAIVGLFAIASTTPRRTPWLIWNASISVPIGLYRVEALAPQLGDLAVVRLPPKVASLANDRSYLSRSAFLVKPVAAVGGDRVCRIGLAIIVRGRLAATANLRDAQGRALPTWRGCRQVAISDVFVLGRARDSFDSRYFGPVAGEDVVGTAHPIWTFQ